VAEAAGTIELAAGEATAVVALKGAEPVSWRVGGRELLWNGDPAHWDRSAPILFPVVGASVGGAVLVEGVAYPMPQHGFARDSLFAVVERRPDAVRLRLTDDERTREHYPFAFALDVTLTLGPDTLTVAFEVSNPGAAALPYALGFHPAFLWPFETPGQNGHAVLFDAEERAEVPLLTPEGLLARRTRRLAFDGRRLPVTPELFERGALVFLDAASRSLRFAAPSGAAITLAGDDFPHLALWTKLAAPFLSLECWTGHADWEDAGGELSERSSMRLLPPGASAHHAATMSCTAPEPR
jgi:galactose mutarotase-like enzyme